MKTRQRETAGARAATTLIGWMGLTLQAPEEWSPVSVSGEGSQGYLKVVSPDTRYLEVKWDEPKGTASVPDALEAYFKRLRRAAKRTRNELRIKQKPRGLAGIRPAGQAPISYAWEADRKALGCIWHCGECNRMVIAELVGEPEDDFSPAAEILRSIQDHGEGGWNTWALFGLTLPAPAAYKIEKQSLMTGHQRFQLRDRGSTLQADRWGLAEIALKGADVRAWYESRESALLGRYVLRVEEEALNGHPAFRITGRERPLSAAAKLLRAAMSLTWPRFFLHGWVWHCPASNRIYALTGEQPRKSTVVADVAARVCCHQS